MMGKRKVIMYVLTATLGSNYTSRTEVIKVTTNMAELKEVLEHIRETKANKCLENLHSGVKEKSDECHYEITDVTGNCTKFCITEHCVELPESLMGEISRDVKDYNCTNDIKEYLKGMYESGNLEPWKYEYINAKPDVVAQILTRFEQYEDCNVSFNATMENSVDEVLNELTLDDEKLEFLWERFGDVLIDDDECILDNFIGFESGTHREEIWHWFDEHYSKGVAALIF